MFKILRYSFITALLFLIQSKGISQIQFQIKPSATEIGKEDVLQVEYKVSGAVDASNFSQPDFTKWKVLSGPAYSSQQVSVNGKTESSISYVFSLQPRSSGTLSLPAASVDVDDVRFVRARRLGQPEAAQKPRQFHGIVHVHLAAESEEKIFCTGHSRINLAIFRSNVNGIALRINPFFCDNTAKK